MLTFMVLSLAIGEKVVIDNGDAPEHTNAHNHSYLAMQFENRSRDGCVGVQAYGQSSVTGSPLVQA